MTFFEAPTGEFSRLRSHDLVGAAIGSGTYRLLLDEGALGPNFFDLSSGVAGDLVQKLSNYGVKTAAVVPDPAVHSRSFQEFALEAGRVGGFRVFGGRSEAVAWLEQGLEMSSR